MARAASWISMAQFSASTTLEKSARRLSPAVLTMRPPCDAISGSTAQRSSPSARDAQPNRETRDRHR